MLYSPIELLALLIVGSGMALQTWLGIGFGLVSAPLLYLINPAFVPGPILILAFFLSLWVVISQRSVLRWRRIMPAIIARVPGAWLGAYLLTHLPAYGLSLFFGGSLLLAVLLSWRSIHFKTTDRSIALGGFFSGLIGTATSVGGPPIALVYQNSDRVTARNELAAFFLIGVPISILMLIQQGNINQQSLDLTFKMLPGVFIGFYSAKFFERKFNQKSVKPVLLTVCSLSAAAVILQGLNGWFAL